MTDQTKRRIVDYIATKGITLKPLRSWFHRLPEGCEQWMVPVARMGLEDPLNRVRKQSSSILTKAGVEHEPPSLRPDPRFKVLVNGEKWPGRLGERARLSLSIKGYSSGQLKSFSDGIATCDADKFHEYEKITGAELYFYPYIRGNIPMPIDYQNIGTVDIQARKLTIRPVFPDRTTAPEDRTYAVELDPYIEGHKTDGSTSRKTVKNHEPYTYPNVSPGEYWLRVLHPGALLEDRQKITVKNDGEVIRPRLKRASSLVVPVIWPEASHPDKLPPELARKFVFGHGRGVRSVIRIIGKGVSHDQERIPLPEAAKGRFPKSVIFPYLPPGQYEIISPAWDIEPKGIHPGCVIKSSSIEVEITKDSPVFVVTEPLTVLYTEKK